MRRVPLFLLAVLLASGCTRAGAPRPVSAPVPDSSVYVDDGGRGDALPILFIHGNGGSTEQWRAQLEHFRRGGRRAVAIDLPGFGRSAAPADGDYSLDAMAAAIDCAVSAIGLDRFVLVGHSYGGAVVAKYAALHPGKVAGVVYVDAAAARLPLTEQQEEQFGAALRADKMQVVRAWFAPMLAPSPPAVREEVLASAERTPAGVLFAALTSLTAYDAKGLVGAYTGPRMAIVSSDLDNPLSFQRQFPEIEAVPITGAGHWLMLDAPEAVNAALDRFLARAR